MEKRVVEAVVVFAAHVGAVEGCAALVGDDQQCAFAFGPGVVGDWRSERTFEGLKEQTNKEINVVLGGTRGWSVAAIHHSLRQSGLQPASLWVDSFLPVG